MDRMALKEDIRKIDGDPDFVFFLFNNSFPVRIKIQTFPTSPQEKAALYKKNKRQIQRQNPENWKQDWDRMKPILKAGREPIYSLETATGITVSFGPVSRVPGGYGFRETRGNGRPVDMLAQWQLGVAWIMTAYFRKVSRSPHWQLVADLVNFYLHEERWDYSSLRIAWQGRKKDFALYNPKAFLEGWLEVYRCGLAKRDPPHAGEEISC